MKKQFNSIPIKNQPKPTINPRRKIQNNKKNYTDYRMTMDGKIME